MKVCDYLRSMSFLDLGPRSLKYRNQRLVFHSYLSAYECKILLEAFVHRENEILFVKSGLHNMLNHTHKYSKMLIAYFYHLPKEVLQERVRSQGGQEAVLTSTYNVCLVSKIRKFGIPCKPHFFLYKSVVEGDIYC